MGLAGQLTPGPASSAPAGWDHLASIDEDLVPTGLIPISDDRFLVAAHTEGEGLGDRRAQVGTVSREGASWGLGGEGWVTGLGTRGADQAFAALSRADGSHWLHASEDGGRTWALRSRIPGTHVGALLAASTGQLFVQGAGTLLVSADGGWSWTPLALPGQRDPASERLFDAHGRVLLASRDGVRVSLDGGHKWGHHPMDGAHVRAIHGPWVAARTSGQVRLGRPLRGQARWFATLDGEADPVALIVERPHVRLLALPLGADAGKGLLLFESDDDGKVFTTTLLRMPAVGSRAAIWGRRGVAFLDLSRRLLLRTPASAGTSLPSPPP